MKHFEIQVRLSGGSRLCDPIDAEDVEDVKRIVLERTPKVRKNSHLIHPGEEIEEVEIYELMKVATIDFRPKVVLGEGS